LNLLPIIGLPSQPSQTTPKCLTSPLSLHFVDFVEQQPCDDEPWVNWLIIGPRFEKRFVKVLGSKLKGWFEPCCCCEPLCWEVFGVNWLIIGPRFEKKIC